MEPPSPFFPPWFLCWGRWVGTLPLSSGQVHLPLPTGGQAGVVGNGHSRLVLSPLTLGVHGRKRSTGQGPGDRKQRVHVVWAGVTGVMRAKSAANQRPSRKRGCGLLWI